MSDRDLWGKAVACSNAIGTESDPDRRAALVDLRELWTALANESFVDDGAIEGLEKIHAHLMISPDGPPMGGAQILPFSAAFDRRRRSLRPC